MDLARWEKLIVAGPYEDPWDGRAIFAADRAYASKAVEPTYHPRRGKNAALFTRYDTILARFGLGYNVSSEPQHVIWPKEHVPPARRRDAPIYCQEEFGIPMDSATHMGAIPVNVHERPVPEWTLSDEKCKQFIAHCFPTDAGKTSKRAKKRAAQHRAEVAVIIYLWFRCLLTKDQIAAELRYDPERVEYVAYHSLRHGDYFFTTTACDCRRNGVKRTENPLKSAQRNPSL